MTRHPYARNPVAHAVRVLALLALPSVAALPGHAQQSPQQPPAADAQVLDTVVISAQRRDEAAQDVGVALSVLPGERIADKGITQINQLQQATPSLEIEPAFGGGQPQFRIRGVGFQDYASNNTPTVGVYVDDVAQPLPIGTQGLLFDLERVEVLRGPQGTLYGRNSTAGAVNFLIAKPTREFSAGFSTSYGSHNSFIGEGYVSGSLAEHVRGRLSVSTQQGGGWQHNRATGESFGDKDRSALRGQLEWDVTDKINLRLVAQAQQDRSDANGLYLFKDFQSRRYGLIRADGDRSATGWGVRPYFSQATGWSGAPGRDNDGNSLALHANVDLGGARLTSITSNSRLSRREFNDWDASVANESDVFFRSKARVFSQELRLASTTNRPLEWVSGLYYSREKLNEHFFSDFNDLNWGFSGLDTTYRQQARTAGVFGQIGYALSDPLKLIAGLRYEDEKRELRDLVTLNIDTGAPIGNAPLANRDTGLGKFSGKLGLEYRLQPGVLVYGNVSRGVKSGGFTAYNGSDPNRVAPFKPESLLAYEVGFKGDLSRTLRLNASAFYYDYRDQQVLSAYLGANGVVGRIVNAPKSEVYGGEVELEWLPTSGLTVRQAFGYKKGTYKEFSALDVAATQAAQTSVYRNLAGASLNFPRASYVGSVTYRWTAGAYRLTADADASYRSKYNSWLGSTYDVKGYWIANARLAVTPQNSPWTVAVWARNLFDKNYDVTRNFFVNAQVALAGEPRTVGVQVKYAY